MVDKEQWDSSNEKAKMIKPEMFGSPEAIKEMIKPIRTAKNRREATEILKIIVERGLMTSKSGLPARLPGKSIGKIVSSEAANASFDQKIHYLAAANLDKLYSNAIEPWKFDFNPKKNNDGLKNRHYLYAPLDVGDKVILVKFTVKEYFDEKLVNKLYSIEAINVIL
ncbi:hypothetical protein LQZ19_12500 [Treponema primitia]|uniref:LPD3 domain-containing protein n=1 Tax=Treponema primitia TaxID=88058 RepID=UPI00397F4E47